MENQYNANLNNPETKETKQNIFLNIKTKTKKGAIRHFSFVLMVAGSGLAQSNGKIVVEKAVNKAKTEGLDEAKSYLKDVFIDGVIESELSLSGVDKVATDWADDF